jgi:uncharacterized membrane protein
MNKDRLEAFSDGVIAIIITIMVLEIKVPHGANWEELIPLFPKFLSYVMSFLFVGIYWINHHHTLQIAEEVNGRILWSNMALLFCLSLIPFVSGWMGENNFASLPVALYGVVMLASALAFRVLVTALLAQHGTESALGKAVGRDRDIKGWISWGIYSLAIPLSFWNPIIAALMNVLVSVMYLIPDRRIERVLEK